MLSEIIKFIVDMVDSLGYLWIFIMMTLESSFFPFPSEVALIPAWFLVHEGKMDLLPAFLAWLWGSLFWAYINYALWKYLWKPFLIKYGKYVFFKEDHYEKSEKYFQSHWTITTFLGRLIPVFRQYISFPAWVFSMNLTKFLFYTGLGAWIWAWILITIWYIAGQNQDLIIEYSHFAIAGAIIFVILSWILYFIYNKYFKKKIVKEVSVLAIFNKKWQLLLQDRKTMSKANEMWWFFGWKVEEWETSQEALLREIEEELNIDINNYNYEYLFTKNNYWKQLNGFVKTNYFWVIIDKKVEEFKILEWDWAKFFIKEELEKYSWFEGEKNILKVKKHVSKIYEFYSKKVWKN
jgi:membrane protein DedA with SNARE-associated domain